MMGYFGDPTTNWVAQSKKMETRPSWGKYWPENDMDTFLHLGHQPTRCWTAMYLSGVEPMEYIQEITEWLISNIDNPWEGPIGYMGYWKFRFTDEADMMAFKLLVA